MDVVPKLRPAEQFEEQLKAFVRAVQERTPPLATGQHGQAIQTILDAIYESSQLDREIEL